MPDIADELESCRKANLISLKQVNPLEVKVSNPKSRQEVMGRIAEAYVSLWLSRCEGLVVDNDFPRNANGYRLEKIDSGIIVVEKKAGSEIRKIEYDFLANYRGANFLVEVKSRGLNGIDAKIPQMLEIGSHIYGRDNVNLLIFCPTCAGDGKFSAINSKFPEVHCVDSGYSKRQLNNAVEAYYLQIGEKPWYYPPGNGSSRKRRR